MPQQSFEVSAVPGETANYSHTSHKTRVKLSGFCIHGVVTKEVNNIISMLGKLKTNRIIVY